MDWMVSPHPKFIYWSSYPQQGCIWSKEVRKTKQGHKGGPWLDRIIVLLRRNPGEFACSLYTWVPKKGHVRTQWDPAIHKPGRGLWPETDPAGPCSWTHSLQNSVKINSCHLNHLVYSVLLWQPELTQWIWIVLGTRKRDKVNRSWILDLSVIDVISVDPCHGWGRTPLARPRKHRLSWVGLFDDDYLLQAYVYLNNGLFAKILTLS